MKAKLNKVDNGYVLLVNNIMYATDNDKLSKQNCDEIFGVFDVDKLAEEETIRNEFNSEKSFINGFNKAVKLNKDKVFTLEDIKKAYCQGELDALKTGSYCKKENQFIQSLQQPTEIEVYLVMACGLPGGCTEPEVECTCDIVPYLDENGCLILKKI